MSNILVVDDEYFCRCFVEDMLISAGYDVFVACNGNDALLVLKNNSVDVVVTDVFMPEKDGIELIIEVKKIQSVHGVIAISGGGRLFKGFQFLNLVKPLGADICLEKPIDRNELIEAVARIMRKHRFNF